MLYSCSCEILPCQESFYTLKHSEKHVFSQHLLSSHGDVGFIYPALDVCVISLSSKYLKSWKWSEATSCAHTIRAKMCFLYIAGYVSEPTFFYTGCFASAETVRFRIILSLLLRKQQKQCCLHFNLFSSVIHSWHRWATLIWFKVNSVIIYCFNEI